MYRRNFIFLVAILAVFIVSSCSILNNPAKIKTYAEIKTSNGDFVIGLYEGTPLHKDNFISNCNNNVYDSTLVYSVLPNSIHKMGLKPNKEEKYVLERNTSEKNIKNEINPKLINKTGAVGMLRLPNDSNPEMKSNNFLFYTVEGIQANEKLLNTLVAKRNAPIIADYITIFLSESGHEHYDDSLKYYKTNGQHKDFQRLYVQLTDSVKPAIAEDGIELFELSKQQVSTYNTIGGIPIYDGSYTVFGEIVLGIDIISTLSDIPTGLKNKPKTDIYITSTKILTKKEFKKLLKSK